VTQRAFPLCEQEMLRARIENPRNPPKVAFGEEAPLVSSFGNRSVPNKDFWKRSKPADGEAGFF